MTALYVIIVILILVIIGAGVWYYIKHKRQQGESETGEELDMAPIAPDPEHEAIYNNPEGEIFDITTAPRDGGWTGGNKPNKPVPIPPPKKKNNDNYNNDNEENKNDEEKMMVSNDNNGHHQKILSESGINDNENAEENSDYEAVNGMESPGTVPIEQQEMNMVHKISVVGDPIDDIDMHSDGDVVGDVNTITDGD